MLNAPSWAKESAKHALIYEAIINGTGSSFQFEGHNFARDILETIKKSGYTRNENSEPGFNKGSMTHWKRNNVIIELTLSNFMGPFIQVHITNR